MSRRRLLLTEVDRMRFLQRLAWMRRSQWYPPDRMRAFQEERLRRIIRHAYAHSGFYRERFDAAGLRPSDIHTLDDLQRIPVLSRQDVAEHAAQIAADNARRYRPESGKTSGTTGARLEFLRDRQTITTVRAAMWRFEGWHGIPRGHRRAEVRSNYRDPRPVILDRSSGGPTLCVNIISREITPAVAAAALASFEPDVVYTGSPTWLRFLSLYLLQHPEYTVRPRVVFALGERVFPDQRTLISAAFSAPVVELYGSWEYLVYGGECEHGRLHMAWEMGIVEILKAGRPCPAGEEGELVLTSLWNYAFPFIRYAIGDVGYIETGSCSCGRTLPIWRIVGGRERDLVATSAGYICVPGDLVATPRWRGKIVGIRFLQETVHAVRAQVVRGPGFVDADREGLAEELRQQFHAQVDVSVEFCDTIEQTAGGKHRFVVSRVPLEI